MRRVARQSCPRSRPRPSRGWRCVLSKVCDNEEEFIDPREDVVQGVYRVRGGRARNGRERERAGLSSR